MMDEQISKLTIILHDEDLQKYAGDGFWNLIQAVISADPLSGIQAGRDIKQLIFHIPTLFFWDKMQRFLNGTFNNFEEQVKLAEKFNDDNQKYKEYVKKLFHMLNAIDDDKKVDYLAALTRCFLLTGLSHALYFKLSKLLITCTIEELDFLRDFPMNSTTENTAMVSMLYQYGLFVERDYEKGIGGGPVRFTLSDFAKALKQNCLNFMDGLNGEERLTNYEQLTPIKLTISPRIV